MIQSVFIGSIFADLASFYDWSKVYLLMSTQILIGSLAILFSKEPELGSLIQTNKKKFFWMD